jgi:hypothetical protein
VLSDDPQTEAGSPLRQRIYFASQPNKFLDLNDPVELPNRAANPMPSSPVDIPIRIPETSSPIVTFYI